MRINIRVRVRFRIWVRVSVVSVRLGATVRSPVRVTLV